MAKLYSKSRNALLKKLENKEVELFKGDNFKSVFGFSYPRPNKKEKEELSRGGDARINGMPMINP